MPNSRIFLTDETYAAYLAVAKRARLTVPIPAANALERAIFTGDDHACTCYSRTLHQRGQGSSPCRARTAPVARAAPPITVPIIPRASNPAVWERIGYDGPVRDER